MSATPSPKSLVGRMLVASPELLDPNFARTLVYMVAHDDRGAMGFVLNRPSKKTLRDILETIPADPVLGEVPVSWGGPVEPDRITPVVFRPGRRGRIEAQLELPLDDLAACARDGGGWVRAFTGYAGWSAGQLEAEFKDDAWRVASIDAAVFDDRLAPGLWPFFIENDMRWKAVLPHLPDETDRN